jgi:ribosomal protein L44E
MRIPDTIEPDHILSALNEIKRLGEQSIPKKRKSTKYDVLYENKRFPPKYVVCLAKKYVDQVVLPPRFNGGAPTNNFLEARGFKIVDKDGKPWGFSVDPEDESRIFEEGRRKYKRHLSIERDSRVSRLAKAKRWREVGAFRCDVCGFDFYEVYGNRGYRYIEAHHTVPVSQLKKGQRTRLVDIALVCSNCHRMLHKTRPWLSIRDLSRVRKRS